MTDLIDYRPDGTIVLGVADGPLRLRRPTLAEYRKLREALHDTIDSIAAEATAARQASAHLDAASGDAPDDDDTQAELAAAARAQQRALTDRLEDLRFEWLVAVVDVLGDRALTEDLAAPWMTQAQVAAEFVGHWRSVPSRSGAPGS